MSNFTKAHNQYLDPPDEPEAVFCEECGEEMQQEWTARAPLQHYKEWRCKNQYCPSKHEGVAKEMAELLIGAREEVKSLARRLRHSLTSNSPTSTPK